jgi:hypothetical protein
MIEGAFPDGDAAAQRLELRWFAAEKAARAAQSECDVLLQVIEQSEMALRLARARVDAFGKLRDALDADLHMLSGHTAEEIPRARLHPVMSAVW